MNRMPAVAGHFYPDEPELLRKAVAECLRAGERIRTKTPGSRDVNRQAIAIVVPHAGYIYSGECAGAVYSAIELPARVVVLSPNHTGRGCALAVSPDGSWTTPLGDVAVDAALAALLFEESRSDPDLASLARDAEAHRREHALEVHLPFLQYLQHAGAGADAIRLLPICVGTQRDRELAALGHALARAIAACGERVLVIISSDMSHYIPADRALVEDEKAIAAMVDVDPEQLSDTVRSRKITMCGIAPAIAGLTAARDLGARRGTLLAYTHSGTKTGNFSEVVAYAGLVVA